MSTEIVIAAIIGQTTAGDLYPGCQVLTLDVRAKLSGETQQTPPPASGSTPPVTPSVASEPEEAFPGLVDSRLFPGLIYNVFQGTAIYEDKTGQIPPGAFRLLWFLESVCGNATKGDVMAACWVESGSDSALRHTIDSVNKALGQIGLASVVAVSGKNIGIE